MAKMFGEGDFFSLPIVDAFVTPEAALETLIEWNLSALVVRAGPQLRVFDQDFLVDALAAEAPSLDFAEAFLSGVTLVQPAKFAAAANPGFVGLIEVKDGQFKASHRYLATRYLSPPRIVRCANVKPHYYPPEVLDKKDPKHCVVCTEPILKV